VAESTPKRRLGGLLGILNLHHTARLFLTMQADRRVPLWLKISAWSGMVYVFSPLDIMPELFTGIGILDDIIFSLIIMQSFLDLAPQEVVEEHCERLGIRPEQVFISVPQTIREARSIYAFVREFGTSFREGVDEAVQGPRRAAEQAAYATENPSGEPEEPVGARYSAYRDRGENSGKEPR
jgi:uncharacterized membrane protein YkvA (DUF1232 family)